VEIYVTNYNFLGDMALLITLMEYGPDLCR